MTTHSLFNPDFLLQLSRNYGLTPSKNYGQNFLVDPSAIEKIITAAELTPTDTVVEVGPGFGVLTTALAPLVKKITSFEIEKRLEPYWEKELKKFPQLQIIWGNVLHQVHNVIPSGAAQSITNDAGYKLIANLPYQITSRVLQLFLTEVARPSLMVVMVQKEVAERICAKPGDMSVLALTVAQYGVPEYIGTVPKTSFWPVPQVNSAILKIVTKPVTAAEQDFFEKQLLPFIKIGFSNRRKLLLKNIKGYLAAEQQAKIANVFESCGLLPTVRAQELSLSQWRELYRGLFKK